MKEYEFNAKTMSWHKDDKGFDVLVIHCYDSDHKLVINCGGNHKRLCEHSAPDGLIETPCA